MGIKVITNIMTMVIKIIIMVIMITITIIMVIMTYPPVGVCTLMTGAEATTSPRFCSIRSF